MGDAFKVSSATELAMPYRLGGRMFCQTIPAGDSLLPARILSALRSNKKPGAMSDFEAKEVSGLIYVQPYEETKAQEPDDPFGPEPTPQEPDEPAVVDLDRIPVDSETGLEEPIAYEFHEEES